MSSLVWRSSVTVARERSRYCFSATHSITTGKPNTARA
jgi:hypothetical protein